MKTGNYIFNTIFFIVNKKNVHLKFVKFYSSVKKLNLNEIKYFIEFVSGYLVL